MWLEVRRYRGVMWFWIKSWRKKEETCWETCLGEQGGTADGLMGTCLARHRLMGDTWDAEL